MAALFKHQSNRILNLAFAFSISILMTGNINAQITETFEDEGPSVPIDGSYLRTFSQGGINFSTSGRMVVFGNSGSAFGADGSHYYLHSEPSTGPATGNVGSFSITSAATSFTISSFASYIASDVNGSNRTSGQVTFTGTLATGGTATETITINTTSIGSNYDLSNAFTGLLNAPITSLSITLPPGIQYIDLDNIIFTTAPITESQYSVNDVTAVEGNAGTKQFTFTVIRTQTGSAGSVTVSSSNGTATAGVDYVFLPATVLNFSVGQATRTVSITVNGDIVLESDETFFVNLSSAVNGVLLDSQGVGKVLDDDSVTETFEGELVSNRSFSENGFSFAATGSLMISQNAGVGFSNALDTGIGNGPTSVGTVGAFSITTPATSFNLVSIEVFTSNNDGSSATQGFVTFQGTKADGSGTVTYVASIAASGNSFTSVGFPGTPFAGVQLSAVSVSIGDGLNYVSLDNIKFGTGTITAQQVSIGDATALEGTGAGNTNMVFTITRTSNANAFSVDVSLIHLSSNNADLVSAFPVTTVTFPSGGTLTRTVTVAIDRDAIAEPGEIFNMRLSNPTNGVALLDGLGVGQINDDDGIIETFEDEVSSASAFSENGIAFVATGQLKIRNAAAFGSGSSNFFLDTGLGDGASPLGSVGSIRLNTANKGFKLIAVDGWTSGNDGNINSQSTATVTFKGTVIGGGTVQTNVTISPTGDIPGGWVKNISFAGTPLDNALLTSLEILIVSSANYISIDNFSYVILNTDPEIEIVDSGNQVINSGGGNSPSVGNNTNFGGACVNGGIVTRTFTIKNLSNIGTLAITDAPKVVLTGNGVADFTVLEQPAGSISALGSSTFMIQFNPATVGTSNVTVSISNNDLDENPYTFYISGVGNAHPDATITSEAAVCLTALLNLAVPSAGSGATYAWSGNGIASANKNSTIANPGQSGRQTYSVVVVNGNSCSTTGTKDVDVAAVTLPVGFSQVSHDPSAGPLLASDCEYLASIVPQGTPAFSGVITGKTWLESSEPFQFVPRHFEFSSAGSQGSTDAKVTLYFTQNDFDTYNKTLTTGFLPKNPGDLTSTLQVLQYKGVSNPNDGLPANYESGPPEILIPETVLWNNDLKFWEVTFPSAGFGGFFVNSSSQSLPVTLVSFTAAKGEINENILTWITSDEEDFGHFEVQRSLDARSFETIGSIAGNQKRNTSLNLYKFSDDGRSGHEYYRLKMVDADKTYQFSKIIHVGHKVENPVAGSFYPNPFGEKVYIDIYAEESENWTFTTFDISGNIIHKETRTLHRGMNKVTFEAMKKGINLVRFESRRTSFIRKVLKK